MECPRRTRPINIGSPQSKTLCPYKLGVKDTEEDQSCSKSFTGLMSGSKNTPSGVWSWIKTLGNTENTDSIHQYWVYKTSDQV